MEAGLANRYIESRGNPHGQSKFISYKVQLHVDNAKDVEEKSERDNVLLLEIDEYKEKFGLNDAVQGLVFLRCSLLPQAFCLRQGLMLQLH